MLQALASIAAFFTTGMESPTIAGRAILYSGLFRFTGVKVADIIVMVLM